MRIVTFKDSIYEDSLNRNSVNSMNYSYFTNKSIKTSNKDINTTDNDMNDSIQNMSLKYSLPDSSKEGKIIPNENDENEETNNKDD